jgi:hypothetical protein
MRRMIQGKPGRLLMSLLAGAALVLCCAPVLANVAAPFSYEVHVDGNTARICMEFGAQLCRPDQKSPLVRKDLASGQMMVIPQHCDEHHCFVDECVPPGTYQWGLADPGQCVGTSSVAYEGEGKVAQALAAACAPKVGPERPRPFAGTLPWNASNVACRGGYCSACNVGDRDGVGMVLGVNGAALAAALLLFARRDRRARVRGG